MSNDFKVYKIKSINSNYKGNKKNSKKQKNKSESGFADLLKEKLEEIDKNKKFRQSMKTTEEELKQETRGEITSTLTKGKIYDKTI